MGGALVCGWVLSKTQLKFKLKLKFKLSLAKSVILTTASHCIVRVYEHLYILDPRTVLTAVSPLCHDLLSVNTSGAPGGGVPIYGGAGGDDPVVEDEGEHTLS